MRVIVGLLSVLMIVATAKAAGGDDPRRLVLERESRVREILTNPQLDSQRKKGLLVEELSNVFDYFELARRSLAGYWEHLTGRQRTEFTSTLRELIELSVLGRLKPRDDYNFEIDAALVTGREARLPAIVTTSTMIEGDEVEIELRLYKSGNTWVMYDMVIDDVSLLNNYRQQFQKIINEKSFDDLLQTMKRRLAMETAGAN